MSIDLSEFQAYQPAGKPAKTAAARTGVFNREIKLFGKVMTDKRKERFYHEMHTLFMAGVDIKAALELLEEEETTAKVKELYAKVRLDVVAGDSLSAAMTASDQFSAYEYHSIEIGEESGRITEVFQELAVFYGKKMKLRRQFIGAFTYPVFVMTVALGVVYFMLSFIVPMFSSVFERFGGNLPEVTLWVIGLSEGLTRHFPMISLGLLGVVVVLITQRKSTWFRNVTSAAILRVPFFGALIRKLYLARFCQSMHLLTASQTPLVEALNLVEKMISFYPMEAALPHIRNGILQGDALHASLARFSVFNKRMVSLIKVAEEVNQLDMIFEKLSQQYSDEVEHQTGMIGSVIEPIMIIFIAVFVGFILIAMYLPLFELSTTIG